MRDVVVVDSVVFPSSGTRRIFPPAKTTGHNKRLYGECHFQEHYTNAKLLLEFYWGKEV